MVSVGHAIKKHVFSLPYKSLLKYTFDCHTRTCVLQSIEHACRIIKHTQLLAHVFMNKTASLSPSLSLFLLYELLSGSETAIKRKKAAVDTVKALKRIDNMIRQFFFKLFDSIFQLVLL